MQLCAGGPSNSFPRIPSTQSSIHRIKTLGGHESNPFGLPVNQDDIRVRSNQRQQNQHAQLQKKGGRAHLEDAGPPDTDPELMVLAVPYDRLLGGICRPPLKLSCLMSLLLRERPRAGSTPAAEAAASSAPPPGRLGWRGGLSIASGRSRRRATMEANTMLAAATKMAFGKDATVLL